MTFLWLVSQFSNHISGSVSSFEYPSYLKSTLNGFLQIQIINSSLKIFPPLPGANKCQYNKQYVTQKVNQGGYTNSTLPTGIFHFLHTRALHKGKYAHVVLTLDECILCRRRTTRVTPPTEKMWFADRVAPVSAHRLNHSSMSYRADMKPKQTSSTILIAYTTILIVQQLIHTPSPCMRFARCFSSEMCYTWHG
jgi:hypothetical protein